MWREFVRKYETKRSEVRKDMDRTILGILLEANEEFKVYRYPGIVIQYDIHSDRVTWGYNESGELVDSVAWFWEKTRGLSEFEELREEIHKFRVEFWTELFSIIADNDIISQPVRNYVWDRLPYTLSRVDKDGVEAVMSDLKVSKTFYFLDEGPVMNWISEWLKSL